MIKIIRMMGFLLLTCVGITAVAATSIKTEHQVIANTDQFYTMKISYPSIAGKKGQAFNAAIKNIVADMTNKFTQGLQSPEKLKSNSASDNVPLNQNSNELIITYKVMYDQSNRVSLRFTYFTSYFMAAHPVSLYKTITYDLAQNTELKLADMFKPNVDYLTVLSNYCQKQLLVKLNKTSDAGQISAGAGPQENNYQLWNITPQGLLISFDAYTVAAGYVGAQQVLVPNKVLKQIMQ